jgi:hypothetical protein
MRRPLSPSVSSIIGYGLSKLEYSPAATNLLFRSCTDDRGINDSTESTQQTDWNPVKIYLSQNGVFRLLKHAEQSIDRLSNIDLNMGNLLEGQVIFGTESTYHFLEIFYQNGGFLALNQLLSNIASSICNSSNNLDDGDYNCFALETDDQLSTEKYLSPVITVILFIFSNVI